MNEKLQNLFTSCATAPAGLQNCIMARVKKAARRKIFEKIVAGSIISIFFAIALVVVGRQTLAETAVSGFGQYLSLIFNSGGLILSDWRDLAWTIVESAPITGLALCLGATGMFIAAIRWTGRAWSGGGFSGISGKFAI
jgi:hypothetical protein